MDSAQSASRLSLPILLGIAGGYCPQSLAQSIPGIISAPDGTGTSVLQTGDRFQIQGGTQAGQNLFHSFDQFNLSQQQTAEFSPGPQVENVLGRVTGGQSSQIDGTLRVIDSTARLFLINPQGIVFGPNARLDLSGAFTATTARTLEFSDGQFAAIGSNDYQRLLGNPQGATFAVDQPGGAVINQGNLDVKPGQDLALIGDSVVNTGQLNAPEGQVTLMAVPQGQAVQLDYGQGLLKVRLAGPAAPLPAPPTETNAPTFSDSTITAQADLPPAVQEATGIAINAQGQISLRAGEAIASGKINTSGTQGGQIQVLGQQIQLAHATLEANGETQGGQIRIGGDQQGQGDLPRAQIVNVDSQSQLQADATLQGQGGQITVWSEAQTRFAGSATAQGGPQGGDGGLLETSGKAVLNVQDAQVDASATQGIPGTWLLDPSDIDIINSGTGSLSSGLFDPSTTGTASQISPGQIEGALNTGTNVFITTSSGSGGNGDITLRNSINQTGGGNAALTLTGRRFNRVGGTSINLNSTGELTFNLNQVNLEINSPTQSIQQAIDAIGNVAGPRQINLGSGVYSGNPSFALVTINKDVTIDGGNLATTTISGSNQSRNFFVAPGTTATIRNVAIVNGQTPTGESGAGILNEGNLTLENVAVFNNQSGLDGGGIDSSAPTSSLIIRDSSITQNQAAVDGGGLFLSGSSQILNSGISGNTTTNEGGGIYNLGQLTLNAVGVDQNSAVRGGGIANIGAGSTVNALFSGISGNLSSDRGGGIYNNLGRLNLSNIGVSANVSQTNGGGLWSNGPLTLQNTSIDHNQAASHGGGIFAVNTSVDIQSATFQDNTAVGDGGGLRLSNANGTIAFSEFLNNQARFGGGLEASDGGNFQIENTQFQNNIATAFGGAIQNDVGATMVIRNSLFDANQATQDGGAINNYETLTVDNTTFQNNVATRYGGAIAVNNGILSILRSNFQNNTATSGGAVRHNTGNLAIADSNFINNQAQLYGGALSLLELQGNIQRTVIQGNQAGQFGGGINLENSSNLVLDTVTLSNNQSDINGGGLAAPNFQNFTGTITLKNSLVTDNHARDYGGGIGVNPIAAGGILNLVNSTIARNTAGLDGGGISLGQNSTFQGENITLSDNQAGRDGGGLNHYGTGQLIHATIAHNQADADGDGQGRGGGIMQGTAGGALTVANTIVAQNQAAIGPDLFGSFTDLNHNLIGIQTGSTGFTLSAFVGTHTAPIHPLLAPLGNYGGLTETIALLPGSVAIDQGSSNIPTDQRGLARWGNPDIGAFESQGFVITASGTPQTTEVNTAFASPIGLAIASNDGAPVDGGWVNFTVPSGITPEGNSQVAISGGQASLAIAATDLPATYTATATTPGLITPIPYQLTTTQPVIPPVINPIPSPIPSPIPTSVAHPNPVPTPLPVSNPGASSDPLSPATTADSNASKLPLIPLTSQQLISQWENTLALQSETALLTNANETVSLNPSTGLSLDPTTAGMLVQQSERNSSEDYRNYWDIASGETLSLGEIQARLRQARDSKGIASAVIYAFFRPPARQKAEATGISATSPNQLDQDLLTEQGRSPQLDQDHLNIVLVLPEGKAIAKTLPVQRQQVIPLAQLFRMAASDPDDEYGYQPTGRQFYQWLVEPFEPELEKNQITQLLFSLDEGLRTLPVAAMMDEETFVIERYALALVPSMSLMDARLPAKPPRQLLSMGADQFQTLAPLPAVATELQTISQSLGSDRPWLNEGFTLDNLLNQQQQQRPEILHLATHAVFQPGSAQDSFIQLWEEQLNLRKFRQLPWDLSNVDLLTFSACATALGSSDAELGFTGLAAASGVKSVLGSIWSVSDVGTLALMTDFYRQVSSANGLAAALQATQLHMLNGETRIENGQLLTAHQSIPLPPELQWLAPPAAESDPPSEVNSEVNSEPNAEPIRFTHPFYWAAFNLVGNPW